MPSEQTDNHTSITTNFRLLKNQVVRKIAIVMGIILVLFLFVCLLVFVIPNTYIFRFSDRAADFITQQNP